MSEDQVRTYRARYLWVEPGRSYAPGELRVAAGRVIGVGPARGGRVPPRAILPSLVNAHVHLQIPGLARAHRSFLPWVGAVMRAGSRHTVDDHLAHAERALDELVNDGVAAVGEIDSTGLSPAALRAVPLGGVCYRELVGFHLGPRAARNLVAISSNPGSRHCRSGLSPHAPYSVSAAVLRAARSSRVPLAIHVAETPEELQFLRTGRGPIRELLERLGRLPAGFRPPRSGAVEYLDRLGVLRANTALIHAQHISGAELRIIARRRAPIVVCPGTIRYFRRVPPAVPTWLDCGIVVALGTDSIASNTRLSMRHEMALARRMWPELAPQRVLTMATAHGGTALGRRTLGTLRRGAAANFVSVPMTGSTDDCLDAFTADALDCGGIWLRGTRLRGSRTG